MLWNIKIAAYPFQKSLHRRRMSSLTQFIVPLLLILLITSKNLGERYRIYKIQKYTVCIVFAGMKLTFIFLHTWKTEFNFATINWLPAHLICSNTVRVEGDGVPLDPRSIWYHRNRTIKPDVNLHMSSLC